MIRATAPGKVVLWGEYAVLSGAPALVMAVILPFSATIVSASRIGFSNAPDSSSPILRLNPLAIQSPQLKVCFPMIH